jgi:ankyrin repeat protein
LETAELLLRAGAKANVANEYGVTPLSLACTNRSAAMVERLLKAGADTNAALWTGETPVMVCARTGNVETVKLLLSNKADPNAKETQQGQTALMRAVADKHPEVVRALIEGGGDVPPGSGGEDSLGCSRRYHLRPGIALRHLPRK